VVLRDGRIEQVGSPMELYNDPDNQFVAGFLGAPSMNFLPGEGGAAVIGVRPEHLRVAATGQLHGTVTHVERLGGDTNLLVETQKGVVTVRLFGQHPQKVGDTVALGYEAAHVYRFDAGGKRLR
jgi:multiple sugar transport system ATP-binding protein